MNFDPLLIAALLVCLVLLGWALLERRRAAAAEARAWELRESFAESGPGDERTFESIVGSRFSGSVVRETREGPHAAIVANVGGRAFYSGRAEFRLEEGDDLGRGFLLR